MKHNVDLLDKKGAFIGFNTQARQLTIATDGDDFVTEFRVISFHVIKQLKNEEEKINKKFENKREFKSLNRLCRSSSLIISTTQTHHFNKYQQKKCKTSNSLTGSSNIFPILVCMSSFFLFLMRM